MGEVVIFKKPSKSWPGSSSRYELIELKSFVGKKANQQRRIRSRIIGSEGKIRKRIEALTDSEITVYGGTKLFVVSRVSDKSSGDIGSPIQFDTINKNWFVHVPTTNDIYTDLNTQGVAALGEKTSVSFISRTVDPRSLDERLYTVRVVVPKESANAKDPNDGFVLQESSTTGARANTDFSINTIDADDVFFQRNPRFISTCSASGSTVTVRAELPHNLNVRPLVISDQTKIDLSVSGREENHLLSIDSNIFTIKNQTKISIERPNFNFKIAHFSNNNFYKTLKEKLLWGKDKRN